MPALDLSAQCIDLLSRPGRAAQTPLVLGAGRALPDGALTARHQTTTVRASTPAEMGGEGRAPRSRRPARRFA
jgi:hypothetical protein